MMKTSDLYDVLIQSETTYAMYMIFIYSRIECVIAVYRSLLVHSTFHRKINDCSSEKLVNFNLMDIISETFNIEFFSERKVCHLIEMNFVFSLKLHKSKRSGKNYFFPIISK